MTPNTHTDTGDTDSGGGVLDVPAVSVDCHVTCPITLEEVAPENVFVHSGSAFDIFALYCYLVKSVNLVNPVNRVPFSLEDLERLEKRMRELCGEDCIVTRGPDDTAIMSTSSSETLEAPDLTDVQGLTTSSVELRLVPSADECIRMEVNLNLTGYDSSSSESSTEDDDTPYFEFENASNIREEDLPPRSCYYSLVEMFHDKTRTARMKADLDLVQYLNYDGVDLVNQMVSLLCDDNFHQMVWEQTFPTVIDTLNGLIRDRTSNPESNVDVEVVYSDCWETYRSRVLRVLNRRYAEVVRDLKCIDAGEAEACVKSHMSLVETNDNLLSDRKTMVLTSLRDQLKSLYSSA